MQPQPLFACLQYEAGSNNKRDRTNSYKLQSHEGIFVSETDKYMFRVIFLVVVWADSIFFSIFL